MAWSAPARASASRIAAASKSGVQPGTGGADEGGATATATALILADQPSGASAIAKAMAASRPWVRETWMLVTPRSAARRA